MLNSLNPNNLDPGRFDLSPGQPSMMAVVTTGNGGYDQLVYKSVPKPTPGPGEVLLRVLAAGVNNTEINTRLGWYSSSTTASTDAASDQQAGDAQQKSDGGWNEATPFPFIQGTDCCGRVVALGEGVNAEVLEKRVIVRACMRTQGWESLENIWMASDFDGAFAEFVTVPASEVFAVDCDWSDAELATIPCAYGTAETMLERTNVSPGQRVLVPGASGGVGSAVVQLAKRRGAEVIAITSASKGAALEELGADLVFERGDDLIAELGEKSVDVVVDNVAGQGFPVMMKLLKRGGKLVSSGAIAGPIVDLDMRDMYLKDIQLIGTTAWAEPVFPNLISYIEANQIRPLLAQIFPLIQIAKAQAEFMEKQHIGNFVLTV